MGINYNHDMDIANKSLLVGANEDINPKGGQIYKAERDPLTNVYSKSTAISLIRGYLYADGRESGSALVIIDFDNFNAINDSLGKSFGDSLLLDFSSELCGLFRSSDVVGRIGGDKFLLFLRGIKQKEHIESKARDIYRVFDMFNAAERKVKITACLGVSIFPQDGDRFDDLFNHAGIALFNSKSKGKNCLTFFDECTVTARSSDTEYSEPYYKNNSIDEFTNTYDPTITDFAFDTMHKTKDISDAVDILLNKVGKSFELSRISVMEPDDYSAMRYTFQWCGPGVAEFDSKLPKTDESMFSGAYDSNDIIAINDLSIVDDELDEARLCYYKSAGVKALLECAIFDSGEYCGSISFCDCAKTRYWSVDEAKTLKTITKIVSSYLLKVRALQRADKLIDFAANYDSLTRLPRINIFKKEGERVLRNASPKDRFAILYMDFDNYKYINEKIGTEYGDHILIDFSERIGSITENVTCCTRVYSDKFIVMLKVADEDILDVVRHFIDDFSATEKYKNPACTISISVGIYIIDNSESIDISKSIDNADIARRRAKEQQENNCIIYNENMKREINALFEIIGDAEQAIANQEFVIYYQPKISAHRGSLAGAEALVRWQKSDGTLVRPNDFIPYLEKSGFIVNVDFYVLDKVCKFLQKEFADGAEIVTVSVNFSRLHVKNTNFVEDVKRIIDKYSVKPENIEVELTENIFLDDQNAAVSIIKDLRSLGFHVSIDDFGSGYSSLNLLKFLPVDVIKLDREFFMQSIITGKDEIIISSIIDMASKMNISVVCEGVETKEQIEFLRSTKCSSIQGYYYSRPLPEEEYIKYKTELFANLNS